VVSAMSMPSLRCSPRIRGGPQSGLSRLIPANQSRVSTATLGRPRRT
jgi:hypothetical protein